MPTDGALPPEILEAIAVSNAKSIGEQPAILANLALANQIANINQAQQQALTANQAMLQITLATVAKAVEIIAQINPASPSADKQMSAMMSLIETMTKPAAGGGPGPVAAAGAAAAASPSGATAAASPDKKDP
jgi:hypothetical protein